jgi:hypothetical protein
MLSDAERRQVVDAFERLDRKGEPRAACYRAAVAALRGLRPKLSRTTAASRAVTIIADHYGLARFSAPMGDRADPSR